MSDEREQQAVSSGDVVSNAANVAVVVTDESHMLPVTTLQHAQHYAAGLPLGYDPTQQQSAGPAAHDPNAFGAYYPAFPVQSYSVAPAYYGDVTGLSQPQPPPTIAYAQTPPLGPTGSISPFPSQSPYLTPVGGAPGGGAFQSPSASPSGSATAAQFYFYSQNHTSPFLHPVQMSPTLSAVSSTPSSPRLSGCPSPTPSFNGGLSGGRSYARSNASRHQAYDMFVNAATAAAGGAASMAFTTNVYIRGLPTTTTDEGLHAMCATFGAIVSSKAIIDQKNGECKGYGFVMYTNDDQARGAINAMNAKGFQASFAKESFSTKLKNLQDPNSTNIYVSNLPLDIDEVKLDELFHPYKILSQRILRDANNVSRGVGFARMESRESAVAVIQKFNGFVMPGSSLPLQARFADSPAQKKLKGQIARKRIWKGRDPNIPEDGTSPTMGYVTGPDGAIIPGVALPPQAAMQFYSGGPLPPPAGGAIYQNAGAPAAATAAYPGYTYVSPPQQGPYSTMQPATAAAAATYFPGGQPPPMFSVTNADGTSTMMANATAQQVHQLAAMMDQKLQVSETVSAVSTTTTTTTTAATAIPANATVPSSKQPVATTVAHAAATTPVAVAANAE